MKALSLTQPWAWIVVHGGKRVENRVWNTSFRGTFLIHASKAMTKQYYEDAHDTVVGLGIPLQLPRPEELDRGGIVGAASLIHVIEPGKKGDVWHFPQQYGFVLIEVQPLPFLPCRGALGFWGNFEIRDGKAVQL